MSSATPLPYNVRYNADTGTLQYEFPTGWINVPLGTPSMSGIIFTTQPAIIKPSADAASGTSSIKFTKADGTTTVIGIETLNGRVGIGTSTPNQLLTVAGNTRIDGQLAMGPSSPSAACLIDMVNPFVGCGIPAMTTAQKNAVAPNRAGNIVFDTDLGHTCENTGSGWNTLGTGGGSGLILQVLSMSDVASDVSVGGGVNFTPSTVYTLTITPASVSSRIMIQFSGVGLNGSNQGRFSLLRGGANILAAAGGTVCPDTGATGAISMMYIDSPATTSPIVYALGMSAPAGGVTQVGEANAFTNSLTLTELAS